MFRLIASSSLLLLPSAASAQSMATLGQKDAADVSRAAPPADVGRVNDRDRGALAGRGGVGSAGTNRTYTTTIGTPIGSNMANPIDTRIVPR